MKFRNPDSSVAIGRPSQKPVQTVDVGRPARARRASRPGGRSAGSSSRTDGRRQSADAQKKRPVGRDGGRPKFFVIFFFLNPYRRSTSVGRGFSERGSRQRGQSARIFTHFFLNGAKPRLEARHRSAETLTEG